MPNLGLVEFLSLNFVRIPGGNRWLAHKGIECSQSFVIRIGDIMPTV